MKHVVERVAHELRRRTVSVRQIQETTPTSRRVTFGGTELAGFTSDSFDDHVKIFVPVAGERIGRDYTPRRFDPVAQPT